jgi:predicted unusual protein kinase regulating ubiquinone biosynthesis (AarF/ABC1/UbiB family)
MAFRVLGRAFHLSILLWGMFLAWFVSIIGVRWVFWHIFKRGQPYEVLRNESLVRQLFEVLGPTFIKLGQIIASSPGLFPRRYSDEFKKCLDRVPPFPIEHLRRIVASELKADLSSVFESFDDEVLGSASIAQVHGAVLKSGQGVVVKVQRPGIARTVDADLWWMRRGAWVVEKLFTGARLANVSGVIEDFSRTIHEEMDFTLEAQNQREFNRIMQEHGVLDVKAPVPVDDLVTTRVLVMERFYGLKADDVDGMEAAGIDAEEFLRKGLRAWLLTVSLHGYFHGDAHAGNLMMLTDNPGVGFLDFGIIGRFTDDQRQHVMRYVLAFSASDYEALAEIMIEIGAVKLTSEQRTDFVRDLSAVYGPLLSKEIRDIKYEDILPDITRIAYRWGVHLPNEFLLILKQLLFFDRYAKAAAPSLNVFNDFYLIDFLFTPAAMKSGLDFNVLMPLMQTIQARAQAESSHPSG